MEIMREYTHIYIHLTPLMLCVLIFIHKWLDLQSTLNDRFFERRFMAILFVLSEFLPEICWKEITEKNTFCILFWCLAWVSNNGFSSNKPTHYLLDHGDFMRGWGWAIVSNKKAAIPLSRHEIPLFLTIIIRF